MCFDHYNLEKVYSALTSDKRYQTPNRKSLISSSHVYCRLIIQYPAVVISPYYFRNRKTCIGI